MRPKFHSFCSIRTWQAAVVATCLLALGCSKGSPSGAPKDVLFEPSKPLAAMIEITRDGPNYELVGSGFLANAAIELRCANPQPFTTFHLRADEHGHFTLKGVAFERGRFRFYAYVKKQGRDELAAFAAFDYLCGDEEGEKPDTDKAPEVVASARLVYGPASTATR